MKRAIITTFTVVMALGAAPGSAFASVVENVRYRDASAEALVDQTDESGCVHTVFFVAAGREVVRNNARELWGLGGTFVAVYAQKSNQCTGEHYLSGYGFGWGVAFSQEGEGMASLRAALPFYDAIEGKFGGMRVNLDWSARGGPIDGSSGRNVTLDGYHFETLARGTSRDAAVTGEVWMGLDADSKLDVGDGASAKLWSTGHRTLSIAKE